jgi:hypothetical protein
MIKRFILPVFLQLLLLSICGLGNSAQTDDNPYGQTAVSLSASVDQKRVPLNRTVAFSVQITWEGDLDLINIGEAEEPVLSNFEIVGTSSANRVTGTAFGKKAVKEIAYTLQPTTLGMGYIEPVTLSYEDISTGKTHHLMTQRLGVEVISAVPEQGERRNVVFLIVVVGAFIIGAGLVVAFIIKKRTLSEKREVIIERIVEETFLEELRESVDLKGADRRESFAALSKLFRRYLSEKYDIPALEATTQQLLETLSREELDDDLIRRCETLFNKADVVKFSGQDAAQAELEEAYTTVETILESHLTKAKEIQIEEEQKHSKKRKKNKISDDGEQTR